MFENSSKESAIQKLLILYIFKSIDFGLTNSQLTQIIMETELMNYFLFKQYIAELTENALVTEDSNSNNQRYNITTKGMQTLNYFISRIPYATREKIDFYLLQSKDRLVKDTQIKSNFKKISEHEYAVELSVIENNASLIDLSISLPSNKQARLICENWKKNANSLYGDILQLLIK
ncbi:hypothetical protein EAL2_c15990 [Peptoclostridium acidaminophilum DSM 3953]|uniref:DUF4364 family protein n=1 Tax=Peptoclostridium acidaminophilum DSM 3953 TaxID=1286171 RepID=W8T556_PEPAC|nr:DUF4364 family protein [Peptoclostridium acidaminophilum]AHM56894.1 hypothetical protein EAL2_c15990 [Peptoclostridium acidaminophilum DSM 3953]